MTDDEIRHSYDERYTENSVSFIIQQMTLGR